MIVYTGATHGGASAGGVGNATVVTVAVQLGETIVVAVTWSGIQAPTVTDNATPSSNTYAQIGTTQNVGTRSLAFWRVLSSKSSVTQITAAAGSGVGAVCVDTWSGVLAFNTSNMASSGAGTTSPATLTLGTALAAGSVMVACFGNQGTGVNLPTWSASVGNLRHNQAAINSGANTGAAIVDNTTTTCAAAMSANTPWGGVAIELTAAPPPPFSIVIPVLPPGTASLGSPLITPGWPLARVAAADPLMSAQAPQTPDISDPVQGALFQEALIQSGHTSDRII